MSIRIGADTDWLRGAINGKRTNAFTAGGWVQLVTDDNAIRPVIVMYDGIGSSWYGVYTNTDGTSLRLSDAGGANASANVGGSGLVVGTWVPVAIRGWQNSGVDTVSLFVPGQTRVDKTLTNFALAQLLYGTDFLNTHLSAGFAYPWAVNYAAADSDILAFLNSSNPLGSQGAGVIMYQGSLGGTNITSALASVTASNECTGFGMSNTTGAWNASMPTFGPTASGNCVLPIA